MRIRAATALLLTSALLLGAAAAACSAFGGTDANPTPGGDGGAEAASGGCSGKVCDCDGDPANGAETDVTQNDPNNCGACGRVCAADPVLKVATCIAGVCNAAPILDQLPFASVVVAHGDDVYFADGNPNGPAGTARHAGPPDFAPSTVSLPQSTAIVSMAVDGDDLYVVSAQEPNGRGYLNRMPRTGDCGGGCSTTLDGTAGSGTPPLRVAISANTVYWVRAPSGNDVGQLMAQPKADAGPAIVLDSRAGYNQPSFQLPSLVVSGGFVYAAHEVYMPEVSSDGVAALPLVGCPMTKAMCVTDREFSRTAGLAADKDTLYYVELGDAGPVSIGRVKDSELMGAAFVVRPGLGAVIAVDDRDFYWVESAAAGAAVQWSILRSGKDGKCPTYAPCPQTVARVTCADGNDPTCGIAAIAPGATQIFFARGGGKGGVFRVPR